MADETPPQPGRQLSLVPYASDSRDIVLYVIRIRTRGLGMLHADTSLAGAEMPLCYTMLKHDSYQCEMPQMSQWS